MYQTKKKEIEKILNGTQSMGMSFLSKINDTIETIMKTVQEKIPGLKNPDGIKEKLVKFTEDIKGPSDILKKMKNFDSSACHQLSFVLQPPRL